MKTRSEEACQRGRSAGRRGDFDTAITYYTEAIRLDPKYVRAYYVRAITFANKGDLDKSIEDFSVAIRLAPKLAVLYCGRGLRYQTKGEYGKAIAD